MTRATETLPVRDATQTKRAATTIVRSRALPGISARSCRSSGCYLLLHGLGGNKSSAIGWKASEKAGHKSAIKRFPPFKAVNVTRALTEGLHGNAIRHQCDDDEIKPRICAASRQAAPSCDS